MLVGEKSVIEFKRRKKNVMLITCETLTVNWIGDVRGDMPPSLVITYLGVKPASKTVP